MPPDNILTGAIFRQDLTDKQAAGSAKIDPLMAMFNAVTLMALNPASEKSFWETAQ